MSLRRGWWRVKVVARKFPYLKRAHSALRFAVQKESLKNSRVLVGPPEEPFDVREILGGRDGRGIVWVPIEQIRYHNGTSFFPQQNHLVRYFDTGVRDLERFFEMHQPRCLLTRNLLTTGPTLPAESIAWGYPWDPPTNYSGEGPFSAAHGNQAWGPVTLPKLRWEAERLDLLKASILERGLLLPSRSDSLGGQLLVTGDAEEVGEAGYRVLSGANHRIATLVHLGWTRIPMEVERVIRLSDVANWDSVVSGRLSVANASLFFKSYFRDPHATLLEGW